MRSVYCRDYITYLGLPPRLYRHPDEIAGDITKIKSRLAEISERLNIRNILTEAITTYSLSEPELWIPALFDIIAEADETLDELKRLRDSLDELRSELEDTKCALNLC